MIPDPGLGAEGLQTLASLDVASLRFLGTGRDLSDQRLIFSQGHQQAAIGRTAVIRIRQQANVRPRRLVKFLISSDGRRSRHVTDAAVVQERPTECGERSATILKPTDCNGPTDAP